MLRINFAQSDTEQRWTLCGQLAGPWVAELRACWEHGCAIANGARPVVDLSDVTFIDESGEKLLSEIREGGAKFVAAGIETKHLLDNLRVKGERTLRRVIAPRANPCEERK
jgi:anti-anti-sigma regulatory factor